MKSPIIDLSAEEVAELKALDPDWDKGVKLRLRKTMDSEERVKANREAARRYRQRITHDPKTR